MKPNREFEPSDKLLRAVLDDDSWQNLSGSMQQAGLLALAAARRRRRLRFFLAQAACLSVLAGLAWTWSASTTKSPATFASTPTPVPMTASELPADPSKPAASYISEQEMLAMFPSGSCVIAEVDGQKTLVFLEKTAAEKGFLLSKALH